MERIITNSQKFSSAEKKLCSVNFLSCVNDYIEHMVAFTVLAKFYSIEYFCNTKVPGLGKIFGYTVVCWNVHGYFTAVSPFYGPTDK